MFQTYAHMHPYFLKHSYFSDMIRYIAMLRGINVGGKTVKMAVLKEYFEGLKLKNIVTYIQSGNVLFDTKETDEGKLVKKIAKDLNKTFGFDIEVILRTVSEVEEVVANNPYKKRKLSEKEHLYISFLSAVPNETLIETLAPFLKEGELYTVVNREVYIITEKYGETKLSNNFIEKKLKVVSTTRNWATVNKITTL